MADMIRKLVFGNTLIICCCVGVALVARHCGKSVANVSQKVTENLSQNVAQNVSQKVTQNLSQTVNENQPQNATEIAVQIVMDQMNQMLYH